MDSSLEENKKIQIDHYRRCKEMQISSQQIADDKISYNTLAGLLPDKKCKILDLGCGEATAYLYLSGYDYYGLECVEEALEIAKEKVKFPEYLKLGMIEEIPFEDEFFDVVWARHVLEHSSDMEATLNEILRVLKPDGLLIYALPQGKHDELAHLYQTDRTGWFKLLSGKFGMLRDGEHPFNLKEYYGVCKKMPSKDKWTEFHEKALPYERAIKEEPFRTFGNCIIGFARQYKINGFLETGFGTGYTMVRIASELDTAVTGIESSKILIKRATKLADEKEVSILIMEGDVFDSDFYSVRNSLIAPFSPLIIYHQGLLEHFPDAKIKELLELQIKNSFAVIFSVPSFFYSRQDFGDERLLTIEQWQEILIPFDLIKLEYYDDKKHILGILKGGFYGGRAEEAGHSL